MKKRKRKKNPNTPLNQRQRHGKKLKSPFSELRRIIEWSSWKDHYMLNMLWACILAGTLERDHYIRIFREVSNRAEKILDGKASVSLCHSFLATLEQSDFDAIFSPMLEEGNVKKSISAIILVETMPDFEKWNNLLSSMGITVGEWDTLMTAVAKCMPHQTQEATDVRWLKVFFLKKIGRAIFGPRAHHLAEYIEQYPNSGNADEVAAKIRATEIGYRSMLEKPDGDSDTEIFLYEKTWEEFLQKTECVTILDKRDFSQDCTKLGHEIERIIDEISAHFCSTTTNTYVNPKMDSSFGLVIYALSVLRELTKMPNSPGPTGRILLRTIVECVIILTYLRKKDDSNIWMKYRRFGSGQAALAFLKHSVQDDVPAYIDVDKLEYLANEDAWLELVDINFSSWSSMSIRDMAEKAGVMDVYNQYYSWTSGFTHAQWNAVRDSSFTICLNPLHRFHRLIQVPVPLPSVLDDCCKLCNRILDELSILYPNDISRLSVTPK